MPFTYLAEKYPDDVAVVWIVPTRFPNLPGDSYVKVIPTDNVTACFGMGDKKIVDILPAKLNPSKSIIVGLRAWGDTNASKERQAELGRCKKPPAYSGGSK